MSEYNDDNYLLMVATLSGGPLPRSVKSILVQQPQNTYTISHCIFRLNTICPPCFSRCRSQLAAKLEFPQTYTVVSRFLGAIIHLCPSFIQARRRTSVLNQCRTQQQCGERTGSQVVWTLLLQSGVWNKPSYWESSKEERPTSSGKYFSLRSHLLSLWYPSK